MVLFKDLWGKYGLAMPEWSLIKKLDRIKNASATRETEGGGISQDLIEKLREELKQNPEALDKKIEEMINSKSEQIKANTEAVKNIESQVSKLDQTVSSGKKGIDDFKARLDKMDETVLDLLSLYEVVSSTMNPFVDNKGKNAAEKLADIEKKVEELSQNIPKVPLDFTTNFDNKIKALESNMEILKKKVDSNVVNEVALVEKDEGKQDIKLSYLDNRPETSIILMNWVKFLLEMGGRNNLFEILEYYVEMRWISRDVSSTMMNYANVIDYNIEKPKGKLLPETHTTSLMFIEQLKGRKIKNIDIITKIEPQDMDKSLYFPIHRK